MGLFYDDVIERARVMVRVYDEVIERKGDVGRFCLDIENSRIGCVQSDGFMMRLLRGRRECI